MAAYGLEDILEVGPTSSEVLLPITPGQTLKVDVHDGQVGHRPRLLLGRVKVGHIFFRGLGGLELVDDDPCIGLDAPFSRLRRVVVQVVCCSVCVDGGKAAGGKRPAEISKPALKFVPGECATITDGTCEESLPAQRLLSTLSFTGQTIFFVS